MLSHFDTIPECDGWIDGQADRQTELLYQYRGQCADARQKLCQRKYDRQRVPCEETEDVSDGCGETAHGSGLDSMRCVTLPTRLTDSCCCSTDAENGD